jgi:hypothetical protein
MSRSQESSTRQSKSWVQKILPFFAGILLAMLASGLLSFVLTEPRLDILAVGLAAIGSVYVGSAIAQKQRQSILTETAIALLCVVLALLGLWFSPVWLVAGYVLHGVWDLFHHSQSAGAQISQRWYPPLCVGFDWAIALFIGLQHWAI